MEKLTKVIAKKDFLPIFKIGDTLNIVTELYGEDTCLVDTIYGLYNEKGKLVRYYSGEKIPKSLRKVKVREPVIAPKGSYKESFLRLEDGREYPSSYINYEDYFTKIS